MSFVDSTVTVYLDAGPAPEPLVSGALLAAAAGLVVLAAVALAVRRRVRRGGSAPAARSRRIVAAGATFGAVLAAMATAADLVAPASDWAAGGALERALGLGLRFGAGALLGALLLGTADLLLDAARPRRTRAWLALAPPLLAGFVVGLLAATGWHGGIGADPGPGLPRLALAGLAGGLVWWSFLPLPGAEVAQLFD